MLFLDALPRTKYWRGKISVVFLNSLIFLLNLILKGAYSFIKILSTPLFVCIEENERKSKRELKSSYANVDT